MTIIKCKMCGGDIQRSEDQAYGTCDSCGSTMTFPRVSDEQRVNLFNRANNFRRQGEFDKAIAAYERILNQDDSDAEAHWGVVLSRYGIEYVEDPASGERIPTCHRVQMESVLGDADYLAALEHAPDGYSRRLYEEEAKRIADIQRGILALSSQEKPYDVFICYKETTEGGSRTPDSALAQEVYYQLAQEGYKVFFSRITLEDKLGRLYKPYIFAALNSARVMVVIGTQAEYFNAVWVKNEWSRFLALMKKNRSKLLIPCYRNMEAYDLPEALSMLQSQDMAKIGFMQDLVRGIKKVVDAGKTKPAADTIMKAVESIAAPGVQSLLTRAHLFLEDGDFKSAAEYAEKVLDIDPKYAPAYMARLQASLNLRSEDELGKGKETLEKYGDYQKAVRFADGVLKPVYLGYNQRIMDRLEGEHREDLYQSANKFLNRAVDEAGYLLAADEFLSLHGYKDSDKRLIISQTRAEEAHLARFKREQEEQAEQSKRDAEQAVQLKQKRIAAEKRRARNKRLAMIVTPIVVAAIAVLLLITLVVIPKNKYQTAMDFLASKQYDQAIAAFLEMGNYSDSKKRAQGTTAAYSKDKQQYETAMGLFANKQYDEASALFKGLGLYLDSASKAQECIYQKGKAMADAGNYPEASAILIQIKDYKDTASIITGNQGLSAAADLERAYSVGNLVTFGTYEQDNNGGKGQEAIQWRVLAREGSKALLISVHNLDCQHYNTSYTSVTWETCTLRGWLNDAFLNMAFTQEQQKAIVLTTLRNANSEYGTSGGKATGDKVFLLSEAEAENHFSGDSDRIAKNTAYAKAQGAYTNDSGAGWWWLRSPGSLPNGAANVIYDGSRRLVGYGVDCDGGAVRPALWIDLSSF